MNFKICEGQLARFVELLAAYDFTIEFRPGISKKMQTVYLVDPV